MQSSTVHSRLGELDHPYKDVEFKQVNDILDGQLKKLKWEDDLKIGCAYRVYRVYMICLVRACANYNPDLGPTSSPCPRSGLYV